MRHKKQWIIINYRQRQVEQPPVEVNTWFGDRLAMHQFAYIDRWELEAARFVHSRFEITNSKSMKNWLPVPFAFCSFSRSSRVIMKKYNTLRKNLKKNKNQTSWCVLFDLARKKTHESKSIVGCLIFQCELSFTKMRRKNPNIPSGVQGFKYPLSIDRCSEMKNTRH